jgi:hypothetical protein
MAIKTGIKERRGLKAILGSTYVHLVAMIAPAAPMKKALRAKVMIFKAVTLMPV